MKENSFMKYASSSFVFISILALIQLIGLSGCTDKEKSSHNQADVVNQKKEFGKLPPSVEMVKLIMEDKKKTSCMVLAAYKKNGLNKNGGEESKIVKQITNSLMNTEKGLCETFKQAIKKTSSVYSSIKSTKSNIDTLYAFKVFDTLSEDNHSYTVGLFKSVTECEKIESIARRYYLPTTRCGEWIKYF